MTLNIQGTLLIEHAGQRILIDGTEFGLEEDGTRNLGDGDFQYEALHIYFDPESRFKLLVESTLFEGTPTIYPAKTDEPTSVKIISDDLYAVEA